MFLWNIRMILSYYIMQEPRQPSSEQHLPWKSQTILFTVVKGKHNAYDKIFGSLQESFKELQKINDKGAIYINKTLNLFILWTFYMLLT
jgi:hypothetical protein